MSKKPVNLCALDSKATDAELADTIHLMMDGIRQTGAGFLVTIDGFNQDRRELWEIPEAIAFVRRIVDFGFLALLESSSVITYKEEALAGKKVPGFGFLELYLLARGKLRTGDVSLDQKDVDACLEMVKRSSSKIMAILNKPRPNTGVQLYRPNDILKPDGRSMFAMLGSDTGRLSKYILGSDQIIADGSHRLDKKRNVD